MVRACLLLLLPLAGCSSGGLVWDERSEWRGATTRLKLVEVDPKLGGPLRFRLELRNGGTAPLLYDDQGVRRGTFEILGPDGEEIPFIGWIASTFGSDKELAPGETAVLLEEVDVSTEYVFERPGRYRARFSGYGLSFPKPDEDWPGFHTVALFSNEVEFTIGDGRPAPVVEAVRRLRAILPERWAISTETFEGAITVRLLRMSGRKGDEIWLQLGGRPDSGFTRLGEGPWGSVWLQDGDVIEPELRPGLVDALTRR